MTLGLFAIFTHIPKPSTKFLKRDEGRRLCSDRVDKFFETKLGKNAKIFIFIARAI
jgi:hypothetical protein